MDLAATLTDFNGNAEIWLLANSLISFICFFFCMCVFHIPLLISVPVSFSISLTLLPPPSSVSTSFFFFLHAFSLA